MVVKIDADVDSRNPSKRHGRSQNKGDARPNAGNPGHRRVAIEPERACVRGQAKHVKNHAVPILRMIKNPPPCLPERRSVQSDIRSGVCSHSCLRAAPTATTVTPRLTHGPHNAVPTITTIAHNGKNDLPKTERVPDNSVRNERSMLRSFLPNRIVPIACFRSSQEQSVPGE